MKAKFLIALGAFVLGAGFLGWATDARQLRRGADAERRNLEVENRRAEQAIAEGVTRIEQLRARIAETKAELEQLRKQARTPPQRPSVMALDAKASAGLADAVLTDWRTAILETKPEMQAKFLVSFRAGLYANYGRLWQMLGLSAAQIERFSDVMVAAAGRALDLRSAMRSEGLAETDAGIARLIQEANDKTREAQREVLGEAGYRQLQEYELSLPSRSLVDGVAASLALTNSPLTATQADQLVKILAQAGQPLLPLAPSNALGLMSGEGGGAFDAFTTELESARRGQRPTRPIIDATHALAQAQEILSAPQFARFEAEVLRREKVLRLFNQIRQMPDPMIGFSFVRR